MNLVITHDMANVPTEKLEVDGNTLLKKSSVCLVWRKLVKHKMSPSQSLSSVTFGGYETSGVQAESQLLISSVSTFSLPHATIFLHLPRGFSRMYPGRSRFPVALSTKSQTFGIREKVYRS